MTGVVSTIAGSNFPERWGLDNAPASLNDAQSDGLPVRYGFRKKVPDEENIVFEALLRAECDALQRLQPSETSGKNCVPFLLA